MTQEERWDLSQAWVRRWSVLLAVILAVVVVFALTVRSTNAAFFASTANPANSFGSSRVTLADDDTGTALFAVDELYPGRTGTRCIQVVYTGTLSADVKLYVAAGDLGGTGLAPYLKLTIEQGSGGSFADCAGFTPDSTGTIANDETLSSIATHDSVATGIGQWSPAAGDVTPRTMTYRFSYALADTNTASGKTATVRFSWTATNS